MSKLWIIRKATLPVEITVGADGFFVAKFPALPNCTSQGKTYDEAILNVAKAIQSILEAAGV